MYSTPRDSSLIDWGKASGDRQLSPLDVDLLTRWRFREPSVLSGAGKSGRTGSGRQGEMPHGRYGRPACRAGERGWEMRIAVREPVGLDSASECGFKLGLVAAQQGVQPTDGDCRASALYKSSA